MTLYRLTSLAFRDLNQRHPMEAGLLHSFIVRLMSERLARATKRSSLCRVDPNAKQV